MNVRDLIESFYTITFSTTSHVEIIKQMLHMLNKGIDTIYQTTFTHENIQMQMLSRNRDTLVKIKLKASAFDTFSCPKSREVNIDTEELWNQLEHVDNNHLNITISQNNDMKIGFTNANVETELMSCVYPTTEWRMPIPKVEFDYRIKMDSLRFYRICLNMKRYGITVKITIRHTGITFSTSSPEGSVHHTHVKHNIEGLHENHFFQESFAVDNIVKFRGCEGLCDKVELCFKENYPLVINIPAGNLGKIRAYISPLDNT